MEREPITLEKLELRIRKLTIALTVTILILVVQVADRLQLVIWPRIH